MKTKLLQKSRVLMLGTFTLCCTLSNYNYVNFYIKKVSFWYGKCSVTNCYLERRIEIYLGKWQVTVSLYKFKSKQQRDELFRI